MSILFNPNSPDWDATETENEMYCEICGTDLRFNDNNTNPHPCTPIDTLCAEPKCHGNASETYSIFGQLVTFCAEHGAKLAAAGLKKRN